MRFIILIAVVVLLISISKTSLKERRIFLEFGGTSSQHLLFIFTIWLYVVPIALGLFIPIPAISIAGVLFIPGVFVGRNIRSKLESSSTDQVEQLHSAVDKSVLLGYGGMAGLVLTDVMTIIFSAAL